MKVLLLGDKFITNDVLETTFLDFFDNHKENIEFTYLTDNWPLEPINNCDEIREFCGCDDDIIPLIKEVDVLLTHTGCITKKVIDTAERLKVVGVCRGGPVNINVEACTEKGIPVVYAPGRNSGAVAEFTVGLMLSLSRNISFCHDSFFHHKRWRGDMYAYEYIGNELSESTVGLIGFGAIGSKVTRILNAFGSKVLVCDPYIPQEEKAKHKCIFVDIKRLLMESDIVSLHARYTKETSKMIGNKQLAMMKESAVLINTARGELVDHDALYDALKKKRIKGAALDVFEEEPPWDTSRLFTLDNVIATTHLAGASRQAALIGAEKAVMGIRQILHGGNPDYCINPEVLVKQAFNE